MGAGFDEHPVSAVEGVADGACELHRLADASVPVLGVHTGGIHEFAGDSGEERHRGSTGFDTSQRRDELLPDRVHLRRV